MKKKLKRVMLDLLLNELDGSKGMVLKLMNYCVLHDRLFSLSSSGGVVMSKKTTN